MMTSHGLYWYSFTFVGEDKYLFLCVHIIILVKHTSTLSPVDARDVVLSHGGRRHSVIHKRPQSVYYVCVYGLRIMKQIVEKDDERKKGKWMNDKYIYSHLLNWSQETAKLIRAARAAAGGQYHYRVRIFHAVRDGFRSHVYRFVIFPTMRWR